MLVIIREQGDHKVVEHWGGIPGFSAHISRSPDDKLTVIVLANSSLADAGTIAKGVASKYIPELSKRERKPIEDTEPETTRKQKAILVSTLNGALDPELFTPPKGCSSMRFNLITTLAAIMVSSLVSIAAAPGERDILKYGDGQADGKKSLGGSGEMIEFTLPSDGQKVAGMRIHGSRYGLPDPPDESFLIHFLNQDGSEVVGTQMAPYSLFERGPERWVEATFPRPIEVPKRFWVALDFRAHQTKGVYVSFDTSAGGEHSRIGLPVIKPKETNPRGDWMIEAVLSR
jgi:hypothetical protein